MKIQCLSKDNLILTIKEWVKDLKYNEKISLDIRKCPILKGTFDLEIIKLYSIKK